MSLYEKSKESTFYHLDENGDLVKSDLHENYNGSLTERPLLVKVINQELDEYLASITGSDVNSELVYPAWDEEIINKMKTFGFDLISQTDDNCDNYMKTYKRLYDDLELNGMTHIQAIYEDRNNNYIVFISHHGFCYDPLYVDFIGPGFKKLEGE